VEAGSEGEVTTGSPDPNSITEPDSDAVFLEEVKGNLDQLVEEAQAEQDSGAAETPSQDKLRQAAALVGKTEQEIDDAPDWRALADLIAPSEEPEPSGWKKDDTCFAQQIDPKTDKPVVDTKGKKKKAVSHIIMSVDEDKQQVTLKDLTTGKVVNKGKSARKFSFDDIKAEQF